MESQTRNMKISGAFLGHLLTGHRKGGWRRWWRLPDFLAGATFGIVDECCKVV